MQKVLISAVITVAFAATGWAEESAIHAAASKAKPGTTTTKTITVATKSTTVTAAPKSTTATLLSTAKRTTSAATAPKSIAVANPTDSPLVRLAKASKAARTTSGGKSGVVIDNETVRNSRGIISEAAPNNNFNASNYTPREDEAPKDSEITAAAKAAVAGPAKRTTAEIASEQSFVDDQLLDPNPNSMEEDAAERKMYELQREMEKAQQPQPPPQ